MGEPWYFAKADNADVDEFAIHSPLKLGLSHDDRLASATAAVMNKAIALMPHACSV